MKYKITKVRNYDFKGIATWPKDGDSESRILSVIDSIMDYKHYVKDRFIIIIEYGIGHARMFRDISAAIQYILLVTTHDGNSETLKYELKEDLAYWPGMISIWCLRTIVKPDCTFGNDDQVEVGFDLEDDEWPYYDIEPGMIAYISRYCRKYYVSSKCVFNVSDITFEKIDDNSDNTAESANGDNNESKDKENGNEQV